MVFFRGAVRLGPGQGGERGAAGRGRVLHGREEFLRKGWKNSPGGEVAMMPWWSPKSAGRLLVNPVDRGHVGVFDRHATEVEKREERVSCRVGARAEGAAGVCI